MARFYAPSILFFDEFDTIAMSRGGGNEHESSRKFNSL
jgi:katanin p60 ATPase-containing subunit A1